MGGGPPGRLVDIHLGGHLGWYGPEKRSRFSIHVDSPMRLSDLLAQLGIPLGEVAVSAVNGEPAEIGSATVTDGDRIDLMPPIGGG